MRPTFIKFSSAAGNWMRWKMMQLNIHKVISTWCFVIGFSGWICKCSISFASDFRERVNYGVRHSAEMTHNLRNVCQLDEEVEGHTAHNIKSDCELVGINILSIFETVQRCLGFAFIVCAALSNAHDICDDENSSLNTWSNGISVLLLNICVAQVNKLHCHSEPK